MKLINNILAAAIILPMATLASCNNDDPDPLYIYNAFVNYQGTEAGTATFTTQEKDDSELITFTTTANVSSLTKGNRYVISYSTADDSRFKSGPIELYQVLTPYQEPYKEATLEEIQELNTTPVSCAPGRTGVYINVPAVAEFQPKVFGLYVDNATMSNELPDVYIIFKADDTKPSQAGTYLGSFDISKLFENHAGIRLHYRQGGIEKTTDFRKGNMTIKPIE
ncbi:MAG: hypothetical protein K2L77_02785 [Muribaculaceae bacterium]|nr:hypothetical protein [Muribaculaceae bacterium]